MEVFGLGLRAWSSGLVFFSGLVFGLLFRAWSSGFVFGLVFGLFFRCSVFFFGIVSGVLDLPVWSGWSHLIKSASTRYCTNMDDSDGGSKKGDTYTVYFPSSDDDDNENSDDSNSGGPYDVVIKSTSVGSDCSQSSGNPSLRKKRNQHKLLLLDGFS